MREQREDTEGDVQTGEVPVRVLKKRVRHNVDKIDNVKPLKEHDKPSQLGVAVDPRVVSQSAEQAKNVQIYA